MSNKCFDIFNLQKECIKNILNLHEKEDHFEMDPCWKILIYDKKGQDLISPLFSVSELRESDITLSIQLESEREEIHECVAIYFIEPSKENIEFIINDLQRNLYPRYYFNFIRPISRIDLEIFAQHAYKFNLKEKIQKICDEYLDFISLESDLFVSNSQTSLAFSFEKINSKTISSVEIESNVYKTVNSLYCCFVTIGIVPVIKYNKGGCAETIARELNKKIKDHLIETKVIHLQRFNVNRPIFLIIDRDVDLIPPLIHSWSYVPLIDDFYNIKINRIFLPDGENCEICDLNFTRDKFLMEHKFRLFHEVANDLKIEVESLKSQENNFKNLNSDHELKYEDDVFVKKTNHVSSAINSLPEKIMRKKFLDIHTNLATKIMDRVQENQIDKFIEIEMKMFNRNLKDMAEIFELISDDKIFLNHKIRLILIAFLCDYFLKNDIKKVCECLHCDKIPAIDYIVHYKNVNSLISNGKKPQSNYENMFSKFVARSPNILQGMKNLMLGDKGFNLTQIVSSLLEHGKTDIIELGTFDPKDSLNSKPANFNDIVIYVVGGGCYTEYQDVVSIIDKKNLYGKSIVYGCTELINADYFIQQLNNLSSS